MKAGSTLRASALDRIGLALVLSAVIWLGVAWALGWIAA